MEALSCRNPPQTVSGAPSSLPDARWNVSQCSNVLSFWRVKTVTGQCCTEKALDDVDAYILSRVVTAACRRLIARLRCSIACSPELNDWWDPYRSVPHLCTNFCNKLWGQCYAADPQYSNRDAFCEQYYTGPGRLEPAACLADDEQVGDIVKSIPVTASDVSGDYFEIVGGPFVASPPPQHTALTDPRGRDSGYNDKYEVAPTAIAAPLCVALVLLVIFIIRRSKRKHRRSFSESGEGSNGGRVCVVFPAQAAAAWNDQPRKPVSSSSDGEDNNKSTQRGKGGAIGVPRSKHGGSLREGVVKRDPFLHLMHSIADEGPLKGVWAIAPAGVPKSMPLDGGAVGRVASTSPDKTCRLVRACMQTHANASSAAESVATRSFSTNGASDEAGEYRSTTIARACGRYGPSKSSCHGARVGHSNQEVELLSPESSAALVLTWSQRQPPASAILSALPRFGPPIASQRRKDLACEDKSPRSLQRGFRSAAAMLHPDRTQRFPAREQKLAEEIFKLLTEAYKREMDHKMDLNA